MIDAIGAADMGKREGVDADAAGQRIVARSTDKRVVARAAEQDVGVAAAVTRSGVGDVFENEGRRRQAALVTPVRVMVSVLALPYWS
ncbi:MAG: hypothetical protein WDN06_12080 [Asticcacaulis sp.]